MLYVQTLLTKSSSAEKANQPLLLPEWRQRPCTVRF